MRVRITALLHEHPGWANDLIGNRLGCSDHTVKAVRAELEATSQITKSDRLLGADNRWYKRRIKAEQAERSAPPAPPDVPPEATAPANVVELAAGVKPPAIEEYKQQRAAGADDATAREWAGFTGKSQGRGAIVNHERMLIDKLDAFIAEASTFLRLEDAINLLTERWGNRGS